MAQGTTVRRQGIHETSITEYHLVSLPSQVCMPRHYGIEYRRCWRCYLLIGRSGFGIRERTQTRHLFAERVHLPGHYLLHRPLLWISNPAHLRREEKLLEVGE